MKVIIALLTLLSLQLFNSEAKQFGEMHLSDSVILSSGRIYDEDFLPLDSNCTRGGPFDYPKCEPGLWCIGNNPPLCKTRSKVGQECGSEYQVCEGRDMCNSAKRCVPNPSFGLNYLKENESCGADIVKRCLPGLWCIVGKCRRLVRCGDACGLETQVCRPGLECRTIHPTKKKICSRVLDQSESVLQEGEQCMRRRGPRCRTGLVCSKRNRQEMQWRCRVPKRLGDQCIRRLRQCEFGRRCLARRFSSTTRCVQPRRLGESCNGSHVVCRGRRTICSFRTKKCTRYGRSAA